MATESFIRRCRNGYAKLLRLYPKAHRERFGEGMEQTFNDLCRERQQSGEGWFGFLLGTFCETSVAIIKENTTHIMQNKNLMRLALGAGLALLIPLALTLLGGVHWSPRALTFYFVLLLGAGLAYELIASKPGTIWHRAAVGIALAAALLLVWMDAAVGTEDDNSGGLMYLGVLVLGIGAIIAHFRPPGMARALFATALTQALVAVIAMIAWGQYLELLVLNGFFIALWVGSALLFRRASRFAAVPK
ncbi:MAG: hypothetical protein AB1705_17630 [Verrucomicrobiota bacterium]